MKKEIVKCKVCGDAIAACIVNETNDLNWLKTKIIYLENDYKIEIVEIIKWCKC